MTTTSKSRFYTTSVSLYSVINILRSKGYDKLPGCLTENFESSARLIIDAHRQTFWWISDEIFDQTKKTIRNTFKTDVETLSKEIIQSL